MMRASFLFSPQIVIIIRMKRSHRTGMGREMAEKRIVCPKCGRADAVRKVTSIVSEGTVMTDTSGLGLATSERGGELVGMLGSSTSRSVLVEKLSPPRKPAKPFGYGCVGLFLFTRVGLALFAFLMVIAATACSFPLLITTYRENALLIFIPISLVAIITVLLLRWIVTTLWRDAHSTRENRADFPVRYQEWVRANERWQHLYYCYRDDGVFSSALDMLIPAGKMMAYLFSVQKQK